MIGQYEVITDEGFLRSPYRRCVSSYGDPFTQGTQSEIYPNTRSSNAASVRAKYFLPYRAAVDAMYRFYTDTWGVVGHTGELGYVHPLEQPLDLRSPRALLHADQAADFYQDIFPRADYANFMARDKELATYDAITAGVTATYEFKIDRFPWLAKGALSLRYDYMTVNYDDFRDARYSLGSLRHRARRSAAARHRAAVQAQRQHHAVLHLRLLLNGVTPPSKLEEASNWGRNAGHRVGFLRHNPVAFS